MAKADNGGKAGRPRKYQSAEELAKAVNAYFETIPIKNGTFKRPPSVAGLCLKLGITRQTLLNYQAGGKGEKAKMAFVVQSAKLVIEDYWSGQLAGKFANGAKFALGAGFGWNGLGLWSDKTDEREEDGEGAGIVEITRVEALDDG